MSGSRDQRIAQIAQAQRGRAASRQLLAAGISSSTIGRLVATARLFPVLRGVFAVGHPGQVELGAETAALLAVGGTAVLSHGSAAVLWGLIPATVDGVIHVTAAEDHRLSLPGVQVHRTRSFAARDVRVRHRLPVLSPARALLDIAELVSDRQFELAFDRALVDRIVSSRDIAELLARTHGRRGGPLLSAHLARQTTSPTVTRSQAEERLLDLIRRAGLPAPRINTRIAGYEVDFYWPEVRFAIEVDGFRFHSTRWAFERDRRKDQALSGAGVQTMRVTWRQIEGEPFAVVARMAQGMAWAARRLSEAPSALSRTRAAPG
ncbi:MAG TPA: DUF559 domain-containing protein [Solirubrobacteraceae bacterium]